MIITQRLNVRHVGALDKLLTQSLESMITKQIGVSVVKKIEQRLQERYGMSMSDAIHDFQIFDATLREFFGTGADTLEEDFKKHLISINSSSKGMKWMTIENKELVNLILDSYGNNEKRMILNNALKSPNVILEILEQCNIPKSSGYRIIGELVDNGLLAEEGHAKTSDGKTISKYTSLFEKIKVEIERGGTQVQVLLKEHILEESNIFKVLIR
jgi:predicted acetyltransferase